MNYLKLYCDTFDLKIDKNKVLDKNNNLIAKIEDDKYIKFVYQGNIVKMSDLVHFILNES